MIPKKIIYCWFGTKEMSPLNKMCIATWKKFCPDYELVKISEENYDYKSNPYAKQGYEMGDWSAVTNAARLDYLINQGGGIYLDTDVCLTKSLDELLQYDGGFITEFESGQPDSGILGCGKNGCKFYEEVFPRLVPDRILHKEFIQVMYKNYDVHGEAITTYDDGFTVLGEEFFPSVRTSLFTPNTIGVHYFENTWMGVKRKVTDGFYPFPRVIATQAFGNKIVHQDKDPEVYMLIKNTRKRWNGQDMINKMNYFFNPRVMRLNCKDFEAERISIPEGEFRTTVTSSGLIVNYM